MVSTNDYDSAHATYYDYFSTGLPNDAKFYVEEAQKAGSPVLELGCGTGRVTIPVAQAGIEIYGLDLSESMLDVAREKISTLSKETQERIELEHGDMRSFFIDNRFKLVMIPYRSFIHLLTPEDQRQALHRIRDHIEDGGRLVFNIFDPRLDWIVEDFQFPDAPLRKHTEFINPETGNRVVVWVTRKYDPEHQVLIEDRIFEEVDRTGKPISREYTTLNVRYTYRYEMEYLLEMCGFKVEALYGDFRRGTFRYGGEQVWIARKS